jgi:hypothetical protein
MRREEIDILAGRGIHIAMGLDRALQMEYIGMSGKVEDARPWRMNLAMAMDAQPTLITAPNAGVPGYLTNLIDPDVIRVLVGPMRAAEIFGETKKGDWTTLSTQFPVVEATGETSSYGDYNNNGSTGANVNWVARQSYHFQTITQWGERELEMYGLAKINYVSEMNISSALVLNKFQNKTYFYGVSGLTLYGALNDPSLPAPISPTTKVAGGTSWDNATAQEIYNDFLKLFGQLQTQMAGLVPDMDAKMTVALSPTRAVSLKKVSVYNVTAEQTVKENFPNLTIKTAPEYTTDSGELMQLKLDDVDGIETTYAAFTEKMRAHPVIQDLSAFKQKKSGGTWGTIIRRPVCIAQMLGI